MSSLVLSVATFGAGAYIGILGLMFALQRQLMYHPTAIVEQPVAAGVPEMTVVDLPTADGLRLTAWYAPPWRSEAPVVAYYHGNGGNIAMRAFKARLLLDAGYGVLLVEYRGFGGNPGIPNEQGLYDDGRAALAWLREQDIAHERIVVYGESLGSGVAVQMAVEQPAAAVILEAPFTSVVDVAAGIYPLIPVRLLMRDRYDNLAKIERLQAPMLLIHGQRDDVVPFRMGERLYEAAPDPKQALFLPYADHGDLYDWGAGQGVVDFLAAIENGGLH